MVTPIMLAAIVVVTSISAALAALLILSALPLHWRQKATVSSLAAAMEEAIFLFDDRELVDATGTGRALLNAVPGTGSDWTKLSGYLSQRVPGFEEEMSTLAERVTIELEGKPGAGLRLRAEWLGQLARLTVTDLNVEGQAVMVDGLSHKAQEEELADLRETLSAAPALIWRTDADRNVTWANTAYLDCVSDHEDIMQDEMTWPIPALFEPACDSTAAAPRRQKIYLRRTEKTRWFDVQIHAADAGHIHFATSADAEMKAESTLRDFIQTLTKTFAHLPIGLAIFDRRRQLALFNPALVDLTSLGADILSARPTLPAFLDRLREARVIPEPKDYASWRKQMAELEEAATSGLYEETWSLPSGQTYKVTGRPHPDGALAFLIEDITAEITLTRHFRSEIELGQSVVDTLSEAIAVFSPAGELILSNLAYDRLWQIETGAVLGAMTITDSIRIWQAACHPGDLLDELREFATSFDDRSRWTGDIVHMSGERLQCQCEHLPGGATMARFERSRATSTPRPPVLRGIEGVVAKAERITP